MTRWTFVLGIALVAACTTDDTDDTDDTNTTGLPDPLTLLDGASDNCNDFESTPYAGATSYFAGDFAFLDGDEVQGYEYWALFTNPTWEATGQGWDCVVAWEMFGVKTAPVNCASCDYSLAFDAYFDDEVSDCHPNLLEIEGQDFTVTYDVRTDEAAGTATLYFADSGNELADGQANDLGLIYTTSASCSVF